MNKKIVVLIPAYEPTNQLITLVKNLKECNLNIIIINDGSNKNYDSIFKESNKHATVLTHLVNQGKGEALKTGIKFIYQNFSKDYIIITMDCDGQHTIKDALKLSKYASNHPDYLVLGSRKRSKKIPLKSFLGNTITRVVYRLSTGIDVYDTQTGLRAFSNKLSPIMLEITGSRFEYEMNVLLECPKHNIKIKEITIETIYFDNNLHTHFNPLKDSFRIYKQIFKFLLSSMFSFLIDYLLYSIFIIISNNLLLSNIFARILSATINFNVNKQIVFNNKEKNQNQIVKYFTLALTILILNTILLNILVKYLFLNKFLAKILVEILLFFFSWLIQKKIIFKKDDK